MQSVKSNRTCSTRLGHKQPETTSKYLPTTIQFLNHFNSPLDVLARLHDQGQGVNHTTWNGILHAMVSAIADRTSEEIGQQLLRVAFTPPSIRLAGAIVNDTLLAPAAKKFSTSLAPLGELRIVPDSSSGDSPCVAAARSFAECGQHLRKVSRSG